MSKPLSEKEAINRLHKLAARWPKNLWLYSANGELCVMRKDEDGEQAMTPEGSVDPEYLIDTIDIENDGGDW